MWYKAIFILLFLSSTRGQRLIDNIRRHIGSSPYPVINEFTIKTNVTNRFAETVVTSSVHNKFDIPRQTTFSVVLPETAFVTGFIMIINGREYKSFVDELNKVKQTYTTQSYHGGGHVGISARDSNEFDIIVNLEANTTTVFKLFYEELLDRKKSKYEVLSNIFPGQLVEIIDVEITIYDEEKIDFINEPYLRTGNEILSNYAGLEANAIVRRTDHWALIKFTPSLVKQFKLACDGLRDRDSFAAQFVVDYDVERTSANQVLANDGYFISFFAPTSTVEPITKHLVFVLDTSWSMGFEQRLVHLKTAMKLILPMLQLNDTFHIVSFARAVTVWDIQNQSSEKFYYGNDDYNLGLEPNIGTSKLASEVQATAKNIDSALNIINNFINDENTNIIGALTVGLEVIKRTQSKFQDKFQPIMVFLTDGEPVGAMTDTDRISAIYKNMNTLEVPTYTISLGQSANRTFLNKLAKENGGYEKHIYDGVDADLQLHRFYDDISLPVLKKVQYQNLEGLTDLTGSKVPLVFHGTEVKVAGKGAVWKIMKKDSHNLKITGQSKNGLIEFNPSVKVPSAKLDKLWAFLTAKQLLSELKLNPYDHFLRNKAVNISLTYSLVTDVTALVVVKPNEVSSVDINNAYKGPRPTVAQNPVCRMIVWPLNTTPTYNSISTTLTTSGRTHTVTSTPSSRYSVSTFPVTSTTKSPPIAYTQGPTVSPYASTTIPRNSDLCKTVPTYSTSCSIRRTGFYFNGQSCSRYRGCENIFSNEKECLKTCIVIPETCKLNNDQGPCDQYTIKWFYNATNDRCAQFWYGGCDGNSNRFESEMDCRKDCMPLSFKDTCVAPKDPGPCRTFVTLWYFDIMNNECREFEYGGCQGNSNKFLTKTACESECRITSN